MIGHPLFLKLFRDLLHRAGMLIALILILSAGVSSYISMAGIYQDLDRARYNYYQTYHLADFTIDLESAPETMIPVLTSLPNLSHLRSRIRTFVRVTLPRKSYSGFIQSIPGEALSLPVEKPDDLINDIKLQRGFWFSHPYAREVIIDEQFARKRHLVPGDRIQVLFPDQEHELLIVGTAFSPEFVMILPPGGVISPEPAHYAPIYLPREFLQQSTDLKSSFNQLLGKTLDRSETALQNTMQLLSDTLDPYGVQLQTAQPDQISVKVLHDELHHLKAVTIVFPTMFLLIAALVFNVMMSRLVTQQRSIIGILKAIGYLNRTLILHYLYYGILIGLLGGLLGIGFGILLQKGMLYIYQTYFSIPGMTLHFYPLIAFIGISISILSALSGTFWGAFEASRLQPAQAMLPRMPERPTKIFLEHLSKFWASLSFQNKMVMRSIFRNRFRSLVTFTASLLATSLVFSSLSFLDSIDRIIAFTFDRVQHQDFEMTLRDPLGLDMLQTLRTLPFVQKIETQLSVPVEIRNGPYLERLAITGLPYRHSLYTPIDQYGHPIKIATTGLVFTQALSQMLHVQIGDMIQLKPLIGERREVKVIVQKIIPSYVGFSAYADQQWLSSLLGNYWVSNRILFQLAPHAKTIDFIQSTHQLAPMINLVNRAQSKAALSETLNQFIVFSLMIMILFAGIIAIGAVINTAMISLSERERDVASLRVLGFTIFQVAQIFFIESWILNIAGILLGIGLGIILVYWMSTAFSTEVFTMPVVIHPFRITEAVFILCIFVVISQGIIYRIIKKLNWFDVLNNRE